MKSVKFTTHIFIEVPDEVSEADLHNVQTKVMNAVTFGLDTEPLAWVGIHVSEADSELDELG